MLNAHTNSASHKNSEKALEVKKSNPLKAAFNPVSTCIDGHKLSTCMLVVTNVVNLFIGVAYYSTSLGALLINILTEKAI